MLNQNDRCIVFILHPCLIIYLVTVVVIDLVMITVTIKHSSNVTLTLKVVLTVLTACLIDWAAGCFTD